MVLRLCYVHVFWVVHGIRQYGKGLYQAQLGNPIPKKKINTVMWLIGSLPQLGPGLLNGCSRSVPKYTHAKVSMVIFLLIKVVYSLLVSPFDVQCIKKNMLAKLNKAFQYVPASTQFTECSEILPT